MAKAARLSPIKSLRQRLGLSQAELAGMLEVPVTSLSKWEITLDDVPAEQLRDIAVVLGFPIEAVRGEAEARVRGSGDTPFGTFRVRVAGKRFEYPIDRDAFDSLRSQLEEFDIQDERLKGQWITTATLDNKLVFLNPNFLEQLDLISDNEEATPDYEHPEVYKVLADWEVFEKPAMGPILSKAVDTVLASDDAKLAIKAARQARFIMGDGRVRWHYLCEADQATDYQLLEMEASNGIAQNRLFKARSDGYDVVRFVNLSKVGAIEVPSTRYLELLDQPDE